MDSQQWTRFERLSGGKTILAECPQQGFGFEADIGWEMKILLQCRASWRWVSRQPSRVDSRRIRNDQNGLEWVLTGNTTNCADYHLRSSVSPLVWLIKLTCRNDVESELSWKFISESNLIFG